MKANETVLLFLDVDGVLLPVPIPGEITPYQMTPYVSAIQLLDCTDWSLVPALAAALRPFPEVQVVVSSTWRHQYELDVLAKRLAPLPVVGTTGLAMDTRYEEIAAFMYKRPEPWLALDDDDYGWDLARRWNLVQCDPHVGISDAARLDELVSKLGELRDGGAR
jgi:hypothetical protein